VGGDGFGQLNRSRGRPEDLPSHFGTALRGSVQSIATTGSGKLTALLLDDQLDDGTAAEVHDAHGQRRCSLA